MRSKSAPAAQIAFGGILAALAVVCMSMGTLIPVATYVCPMLCALLLQVVLKICGKRIAWAWYGAVSILSLLMAPDKEAAVVYLALGYYPIVKPWLDRRKMKWLWKGFLFNGIILLTYWLLMHLVGFENLQSEFSEMGTFLIAVMMVLGNVTFFLLDKLLEKKWK